VIAATAANKALAGEACEAAPTWVTAADDPCKLTVIGSAGLTRARSDTLAIEGRGITAPAAAPEPNELSMDAPWLAVCGVIVYEVVTEPLGAACVRKASDWVMFPMGVPVAVIALDETWK